MPVEDNKLLAVDSESPDGAPEELRDDDFDFGADAAADLAEVEEGLACDEPLRFPSPFMRPL